MAVLRQWKKSGILLQTGEVAEASDGHLTRLVFILEDPIAHLEISNPSGILIIEKQSANLVMCKNHTSTCGQHGNFIIATNKGITRFKYLSPLHQQQSSLVLVLVASLLALLVSSLPVIHICFSAFSRCLLSLRIFFNPRWCFHIRSSSLNPRRFSLHMYKYACFFFFQKTLAMTDSLSISILLLSCIILKSALSFGYQTNIALVYLFRFFWYSQIMIHR